MAAIMPESWKNLLREWSIWAFAFGYFAAYVPYSSTAKAVSKGLLEGQTGRISGFSLLPLSVAVSVVGMILFITIMGWWKYAGTRTIAGRQVPSPSKVTGVSGLLTAGIIVTTTLAYTFEGVSIVFVMLLMRGGVLIIAPVIDALTGRKTRWFSWVGLLLSLGALVVAFSEAWVAAPGDKKPYDITIVCAVDIALYLGCYFFRLRFMTRNAKSQDNNSNLRYFVEEQMVASPAMLLLLVAIALVGPFVFAPGTGLGDIVQAVRWGFTDVFDNSAWPFVIFIGFCSQLTGIFGGLVLLDKRENTYSVPVNRCSSILAGVIATYIVYLAFDQREPSGYQLFGAGMIVTAILFLTIPPMMAKRAQSAESAPASA